jgi:hypothetical protein
LISEGGGERQWTKNVDDERATMACRRRREGFNGWSSTTRGLQWLVVDDERATMAGPLLSVVRRNATKKLTFVMVIGGRVKPVFSYFAYIVSRYEPKAFTDADTN